MRVGLVGRVLLGAGVPTVVAVTAFATMLGAIDGARRAQERVSASHQTVVAAEGLSRAVGDLTASERGLLLGDLGGAGAWSAAGQRVHERAEALAALRVDGADERRRTAGLAAAAEAYLQESRRVAGPVAAGAPARTGLPATDPARVTEFAAHLDAFLAEEQDVVAAQERAVAADARWAVAAGVAGLLASLVSVVLVGIYLTRAVALPVRRAGAVARQFADGDLRARLPVTGVGDIGDLQRALNRMAASLAAARDELTASRARIVAADYRARRAIERDLHDGLQQRLVALALDVRGLGAEVPDELREQVDEVATGLVEATNELRDFVHGIQPAALTQSGLGAALRALARRAALPVEVRIDLADRLPADVESAAYYFVSEALTNATKHAHASYVEVTARIEAGLLRVTVADDGVGGADRAGGTGLVGLADRIDATGGRMTLVSEAGQGTTLTASIPISWQAGTGGTG